MVACSIIVKSDPRCNKEETARAIEFYSEVLSVVRTAIEDPQQAIQDATLVATILLYYFEVGDCALHKISSG